MRIPYVDPAPIVKFDVVGMVVKLPGPADVTATVAPNFVQPTVEVTSAFP